MSNLRSPHFSFNIPHSPFSISVFPPSPLSLRGHEERLSERVEVREPAARRWRAIAGRGGDDRPHRAFHPVVLVLRLAQVDVDLVLPHERDECVPTFQPHDILWVCREYVSG